MRRSSTALAGAVALLGAACSGGSSEEVASTSTTSGAAAPAVEEVIVDLWQGLEVAIAGSSVPQFEAVMDDPALLMHRFYWIDYCTDYCGPPPAPVSSGPEVEVLARSADGSAAVALVSTTSDWPEEEPVALSAVVRVDDTAGEGWQITLMDEWAPTSALPEVPSGELAPLHEAGRELTAAYLDLVGAMSETGEYPADSDFADGQFTNEHLDAMATYKAPEPWEDESFEERLAAENEDVGFTIEGADGRDLHCALYSWSSTVRHVDDEPITPLPVLGDFAHLIEEGTYASFTVDGYDSVCIIEVPNEPAIVLAYGPFRTSLTGTPIRAS